MNYTVVWSAEAEVTYIDIVSFLEEHWSEKQVLRFVKRTEEVIRLIESNPKVYPHFKTRDIHRAVVNKQISLYYYMTGDLVVLLSFEDNRQDPDKITY